jgi:N-acyl-D-amino-acid deacylase
MGLEDAIRRMTSLPATKFNLRDRGLLLEGKMADILILDADKIQDNSTFEAPHQFTTGISHVWVNGGLVLENGKHTGLKTGKTLHGNK